MVYGSNIYFTVEFQTAWVIQRLCLQQHLEYFLLVDFFFPLFVNFA